MQVMRGHSREAHIVGLEKTDDRDEPAKSLILRLLSEPLPLTPSVGSSGIVRSIVGQIDGPHDSLFEIRSNGLILESGEVGPSAKMAIHAATVGAVGLVLANYTIISDYGGWRAEEATSPICDLIVVLSRTENVATAAEPAQHTWIGRITENVTIVIAIIAVAVSQIVAANLVKGPCVGPEGEVLPADAGDWSSTVTLLEIVENHIFDVSLAVVNWLFADYIEA